MAGDNDKMKKDVEECTNFNNYYCGMHVLDRS